MIHYDMIWIISLENVLMFFKINDEIIIYFYLFAFNFSSNMLILFFNVL
jgi:hypothetical protein